MSKLHCLENNWKLWFHNINNNDWSINGYEEIYKFNSIEEFIILFRKINNFSAGMFFVMKENIEPLWENKYNKNGGYWSFKILKKNINSIWYNLTSQIIGNNCLKDIEKHNDINGISLSPKINNCIIKIWFSKVYDDINIFNIDYLQDILVGTNIKDGRFIRHS